jgi:prepilin-type N-terminal cleavage/methylation domain-containing protein
MSAVADLGVATRAASPAAAPAACAAARAAGAPPPCARPRARGFTLIEVMIALGLLLVGGVSVLSVFALAVVHRVERDLEAKVDLLRPEVRTMAQEAVDRTPAGKPTPPVGHAPGATEGGPAPLSVAGFGVAISFSPSPNGDPAQVAHAQIFFRGKPVRQGRLPPLWLHRSTLDSR